jgi:acetaldehyde dehydrogenase (acetylating)
VEFDKDLCSIQEVRNLVAQAKKAQQEFSEYTQEQVNAILEAISRACEKEAERLAKMAVEETGFGIWQDKVLKNLLGSRMTWQYIRDMKTIGILREDRERKIMEVAAPVGIVAALIPSTNPTSTVMYKTLISLKGGNAIIISPHPNAKKCILETYSVIEKAARSAGAPAGLVQCISIPTMAGTDALLKHPDIGMILATGGQAMVHAAYSSGNPALGVGPGNGPSFIEKSADIAESVRQIIESKTFDNGTICASEQSIITETCIEDRVVEELKRQGGYFLTEDESRRVGSFIMRANGTMNPRIVGRSADRIAEMAGIQIPAGTKVLISRQTTVGHDNPYSREKLCPILAFYVEDGWENACRRSIELLQNEGVGHTMTIHTQDEHIVREFALKKPVMRILVNTPGSLGGVGATTGLQPALTLGCGAVGGSATSDNVGPMNLINIRRVAYGLCELKDLREQNHVPSPENPAPSLSANQDSDGRETAFEVGDSAISEKVMSSLSREDIEKITRAVLARFNRQGR